jgi:spore maturation protein A
MLNTLWFGMILVSVVFGVVNGKTTEVINAVTEYAKLGFTIALGLTGVMTFWLGLMNIAERSGLMRFIAHILNPLMKLLFPKIPADHPAIGAVVMNISANMLGIGHAATPMGLKAMEELQSLNEDKETASDAMCMFLAINTSSVQLVPVTAIAFLAANGSTDPTSIVLSSLIATICSTIAGISVAKLGASLKIFKPKRKGESL